MGAVAQFRVMGGVIGLAIVTSIFNSFIRSDVSSFLSGNQVDSLLKSTSYITTLSPTVQISTRDAFSAGYNLQMKILAGFAGGQVLSSFLMWRKDQIKA
jgi:hypothetical protein